MKNKATSRNGRRIDHGILGAGCTLVQLYVLVGLFGGILAVCMDDDYNGCIRRRWLDVPVVE